MFLGSKTMYSSRSVDFQSLLSEILIKIFDTPCCRTGGEVATKIGNIENYEKVVGSFEGKDRHITMVQDWWK